jgi:hypothetical protein
MKDFNIEEYIENKVDESRNLSKGFLEELGFEEYTEELPEDCEAIPALLEALSRVIGRDITEFDVVIEDDLVDIFEEGDDE